MISLGLAGMAFVVCAIAGYLTGRLKSYQADGLLALAYPSYWIANVLERHWLMAAFDAAGFAWFAYKWWNGGGGDDTKRRLRKWARKFQGVRRTAPAAT